MNNKLNWKTHPEPHWKAVGENEYAIYVINSGQFRVSDDENCAPFLKNEAKFDSLNEAKQFCQLIEDHIDFDRYFQYRQRESYL